MPVQSSKTSLKSPSIFLAIGLLMLAYAVYTYKSLASDGNLAIVALLAAPALFLFGTAVTVPAGLILIKRFFQRKHAK
ncbi:MAG: hypothetical protein JWO41_552 [Candidatus Saccharibacteria bacterium]|nr:hypothetical protein [Candidatus Saccharibacteria bacterium]